MPNRNILIGSRIPGIRLGYYEDGEVQSLDAPDIFAVGRSVVMGVPGAFTPVCTRLHVPDFVRSADSLRASGFGQLICIVPNDPFVVAEWAAQVDPGNKLRFLSDGNLEFTSALGLQATHRDLFLGMRSERYLLVIDKGVIVRFKIEPNIFGFTCTRAQDVVEFS